MTASSRGWADALIADGTDEVRRARRRGGDDGVLHGGPSGGRGAAGPARLMHAFDVLGDPVRRRILELLASGELTSGAVTEVVREEFGISQPAVSQHLKVLRENGFATVRPQGTRRLYAVDPAGLREVDAWVQQFSAFWEQSLDALGTELARRASVAPHDHLTGTVPAGWSTCSPPTASRRAAVGAMQAAGPAIAAAVVGAFPSRRLAAAASRRWRPRRSCWACR